MTRYFVAHLPLALAVASSAPSACAAAHNVRLEAAQALYENKEIVGYACVEDKSCSWAEFAANLDVKALNLGASPRKEVDAILVEPSRKGRQFFSAVFIKQAGKYVIVFSPDTALSGLKIVPEIRGDLHVLRGTERESAESWKETDYGFDCKSNQYAAIRTRCYQQKEGKTVRNKCDG